MRMLVINGADGCKIRVVHDGIRPETCAAPDWDAKLKGPQTAKQMGAAGRETSLLNFDNATCVEKVDALLREALNR